MQSRLVSAAVQSCLVLLSLNTLGQAQQAMEHDMSGHQMGMEHEHGSGVPVTYEELTKTTELLGTARKATAKYQDVRVAEADGFRAIGPDVPGMGIHYVASRSGGFDIERPSILLYEKNAASAGGYALVGVSYLLSGEPDADGQPKNPPFPKSLASWHRHSNLCVFPDRSVKGNLSEADCVAKGGKFNALTQWMIHAWIWKDSPTGVFSPTNPKVQ